MKMRYRRLWISSSNIHSVSSGIATNSFDLNKEQGMKQAEDKQDNLMESSWMCGWLLVVYKIISRVKTTMMAHIDSRKKTISAK